MVSVTTLKRRRNKGLAKALSTKMHTKVVMHTQVYTPLLTSHNYRPEKS